MMWLDDGLILIPPRALRSIYLPPSALLIVKNIRNMHINVVMSSAAPRTEVDDGGFGSGDAGDDGSSNIVSVLGSCSFLLPFWSFSM
mmetsp:Transcript_33727/g.68596  ORF Transcript_33727/g.68596 Transcript_33727/m.68596 type:complete len:87 (-) Transcript_33727:60-320(-)